MAKIDILNHLLLSKIVGSLSNKDEKKIKNWYNSNKDLLILTWNELYPDMSLKN